MQRIKKKINPKLVISLILLASFAVLLTASILVNVLSGGESGGVSSKPELPILEGESSYGKFNLAYPQIAEEDVQYISVSDKANSFEVARTDDSKSLLLVYTNEKGERETYYPNILGTDESVDYSSLYAIDQTDGLGMVPAISYLCSAVGLTTFQARIPLSSDPEERYAQLASFGLTSNERVSVSVSFTVEGEEKEQRHTIHIGKQNISGAGRYYIVDEREYVYCSATSYMEYALRGFVSFVKPYIVTEGISGDESLLAAYLTQDFSEWKNTVHDKEGDVVVEDSRVIAMVQEVKPYDYPMGYLPNPGERVDGYEYGRLEERILDLKLNESKPDYIKMMNALVGKTNGVYYDELNPDSTEDDMLRYTFTSPLKSIDFKDKESIRYDYEIIAIEAIITDEREIIDTGTPVGDNTLLKITYNYTVDGKAVTEYTSHALIDFKDKNVDYVVSEIIEIKDKDGKRVEKVTEDSSVFYRYHLVVDGKVGDSKTATVSLAKTDGETEEIKQLRAALLGKQVSKELDIKVRSYIKYSGIPTEVSSALRSAKIGELSSPIKFSMDYTKETAARYDTQTVICDIIEIYDKNGKAMTKVTEDSEVLYRYYLVIDGKVDDDIHVARLSPKAEDDTDYIKQIRKALIGREISSNIELVAITDTDYSELLYDFITYRISEIKYFVTGELVSSFGFVNWEFRDRFFGESIYENQMDGKNSLYGINADACIEIVKILTGINASSSSTQASGLVANETVALGLSPEIMDKYDLYDYTIHLEIPRGIVERNDEYAEDEEELSNYDWLDTLSFEIYVSRKQYDGTRYIASDMYDLVAKIDGAKFDFLELDFTEYWARNNLLMVDFLLVEKLMLKFDMADVYGEYSFDMVHERVYVDDQGVPHTQPPENGGYDRYDISHINTSQSGNCMETELSKYLASAGLDSVSMSTLYNNVRGDGSMIMGGKDSLGSTQFKNLMHLIYGTYYTGTLSEEEKAAAKENAPIMRLDMLIETSDNYYTYEFYRVDDRRVMVSLSHTDEHGNNNVAEDFYISSFAFKKVVRGFVDVLNAKDIDSEISYSDED